MSKDVIVIEYEHDRASSKAEKIELEKSKRVISGFEVNREWTAKELERELSALLKGTQMEGFCHSPFFHRKFQNLPQLGMDIFVYHSWFLFLLVPVCSPISVEFSLATCSRW